MESLGVRLGGERVLHDVSLHFHCGELTALLGPNGAGKTTLLRAILGEVRHSGRLVFHPGGGPEGKPRIGYVPQQLAVDRDTPMEVRDFLAVCSGGRPAWLGVGRSAAREAAEALDRVSARHLLRKRVGELSGGELQRVLLAVAMWPPPDLLLLDEPLSGVDPRGVSEFVDLVCDQRRLHDMAIILVTHDLVSVAPHADRVVLLHRAVVADGKPCDILRDRRLAELLGAGRCPTHAADPRDRPQAETR